MSDEVKVKVQGYSFSLYDHVVLGTPKRIDVCSIPKTTMQARRVVTNVPSKWFGMVDLLGVFYCGKAIGRSSNIDAAWLGAGQELCHGDGDVTMVDDGPWLRGPVRLLAQYTGAIPDGVDYKHYKVGFPFLFIATLQGPARLLERRAA